MRSSKSLAVVAGLCALVGCGKVNRPETKPKPSSHGLPAPDTSAGPADVALAAVAPPTVAAELGLQLQIDLPRSAATDVVAPTWQNPKPGVQASRVWNEPTVIVGRRQVFVGDQPIASVTCTASDPTLCDQTGLTGPSGKQRLDLEKVTLDANHQLAALQPALAAKGWAGKPVYLLVDRRMTYHAVEVVARTLIAAGSEPILMAATDKGDLVRALPSARTKLEPFPLRPGAPCDATGQDTNGDGSVPDDLSGVVVHVTAGGIGLELLRKGKDSVGRELIGHVGAALGEWARRIRSAAPQLDHVTVLIDPVAPWEEAVRVVDALRDTCAVLDAMTECHARQALFPHVELVLDPHPAPATLPPAPAPNLAPVPNVPPVQLRGDLLRRDGPVQRPDLQLPPPPPPPPSPQPTGGR